MTWPSGRARDGGVDAVPVPGVAAPMWLCGKHAIGPDVHAVLHATGASMVVALVERHELADRYPSYVEWLDTSPAARWHPMPDLGIGEHDAFVTLVDEVRAELAAGRPVVVHCGAGIGRAGTVAAAVLVRSGCRLDDALAHLARHRPMAGPEAGAQREALERLAHGR